MARKREKYMPHNPRTAAVLIAWVEREKPENGPRWDDSLDASDNWMRRSDYEYESTKMLLRELKRLDWENQQLRQVTEHLRGGEELLTRLDNMFEEGIVHETISYLDDAYASPYAAHMTQEEIQRLIFED